MIVSDYKGWNLRSRNTWSLRGRNPQLAFGQMVGGEEKLVGVHPDLVSLVRSASDQLPFDFRVTSGVRSDAEQAALYAQVLTAPGPVVTNAPTASSSAHRRGTAV